MFNILNKKGFAYLGLVVSVLIVALLFFGSFYFSGNNLKNNKDAVDLNLGDNFVSTLNNAKEDITEINENIEDKNDKAAEALFITAELEKWHILKREDNNFELKYPRGWYYTVKHKEAIELGYELLIGFEPNAGVWEQNPPYSIELIQLEKDFVLEGEDYSKEINLNNKKYIIKTTEENKEKYSPYIDQMIKTLKLIN
jgi:hypothetical protein